MSRARDLSKLGNPNVIKADENSVGFGTQVAGNPANPDSSLISAGIVSATAFYGDGSNLDGVASAGLGTALSEIEFNPLTVIYQTSDTLSINQTVTVDPPDSTSNVAYTQYSEVKLEDGADLIIADGDDFIPDILGLSTEGSGGSGSTYGNGVFGTIYADNIERSDGRGAPSFPQGANVVGVLTAASGSFSGNISIGGTLTYEDVTNVDSIGIVTARSGIKVTGGGINVTAGGIDVAAGGGDISLAGNLTNVTTSATDAAINIYKAVGDNADKAILRIGYDESLSFKVWRTRADANIYIESSQSNSNIVINSNNGGSVGERLRIGAAGQIGLSGANYGTSGQVLTSQGASAAPQWADAPASGWNIIARGSSSTSAQSFVVTTDAITSTYEFYHLMFTTGGADHHAAIDITQDGTTWVSAAGGTQYSCAHSGQWQGGAINGQNTSNTYGYIYGNPSSTNQMEWYNAEVFFHGAHRTDARKQFNCRFTYLGSGAETGGTGQSNVIKRDSNAAFTGIRIYTTNNVSRAEWCLLGMKLS